MYADHMTRSMNEAIQETNRRRTIQENYNQKHGITPKTIQKEIYAPIKNIDVKAVNIKDGSKTSRTEIMARIAELEKQMKQAAKNFDFEYAAELRDIIFELKEQAKA